MIALALEAVPDDIKTSDRCVIWRRESTATGGTTKVPYVATDPWCKASSIDPDTWRSFLDAQAAVEDGKADGPGFVLGDGWIGIDIDHCVTNGVIDADAQAVIDMMQSYTEVSPSGTGVHILVRGTLPAGGRKKGRYEIYNGGRYFTVTGVHVPGTPTTIRTCDDAVLTHLHASLFPIAVMVTAPSSPTCSSAVTSDTDLLTHMFAATNGGTIQALWNGDISRYASQSEADLALCAHLAFWTDRDAASMDRLFRQSGLFRPKWDTRRGTDTYGGWTIAKAIAGCAEGYHGTTDDVTVDMAATVAAGTIRPPLELTSIGDLLAEPDDTVDWLVDGLIPAGAVCLIAAKPKVGKSTAARDLALALARGDSWLGCACSHGTVWYLAFEGRRRDVKNHFLKMGATSTDPIRLFIGQAPKNIVAAVLQRAKQERPELIIIDTMQRFLRAHSTDDYAEMTLLFDSVLRISQESGATLLLLHHSSKADRASIDAVLGSTAIAGSVDNIILLARTDRYRTISTIQRVGEDHEEQVLLLDSETGRLRLGGSRAQADREFTAHELMRVLDAAGGSLTRKDWFDRVEIRTAVKVAALRELESGNKIQREGRGNKNDPYRYSITVMDSCSGLFLENGNKNPSSSPLFDSVSNSFDVSCSRIPAQEREPSIGPEQEGNEHGN